MALRNILVIGLAVGVAAAVLWRLAPRKSRLFLPDEGLYFPIVSGYNLNRQEFEFPRDFEGELNLVIVPFQRYQQTMVDTWIPAAQEIEFSFPGVVYYELPTIYEMPVLSRLFLNEGMRAGIPDGKARQRTVTLYLDKDRFKQALDIPSEDDIYLFLVDRQGNILWRETGAYSLEKADDLSRFLEGFSQ